MTRIPTPLAALFCLLSAFHAAPAEYDLYILAGQSNMDGYGLTKELDEADRGEVPGVHIFHGSPAPDGKPASGAGLWAPLRPGHGRHFKSDGGSNKYSDAFGPELFFAKTLRSANPDRKIAIIKYSRGGTSIHPKAAGTFGCWDPDFTGGQGDGQGINQYDHFLATLNNALAIKDIDGDGTEDRLVPAGILWMQGESDASYTPGIARAYQASLSELMGLMRDAVQADDLPIVLGRISDSGQDADGQVWNFADIVRKAQADFVEQDGHAALVTTTDAYGYSDPWHYDTAGFIDLGKQFALQMQGLRQPAE